MSGPTRARWPRKATGELVRAEANQRVREIQTVPCIRSQANRSSFSKPVQAQPCSPCAPPSANEVKPSESARETNNSLAPRVHSKWSLRASDRPCFHRDRTCRAGGLPNSGSSSRSSSGRIVPRGSATRSRSSWARWERRCCSAIPSAVREIFQLAPDSYECRPFNDYYRSVMGDKALFLYDGADHRRMRKVLDATVASQGRGDSTARPRGSLSIAILGAWPAGKSVFAPARDAPDFAQDHPCGSFSVPRRIALAARSPACSREEIYQHLGSWSAWTRFSHLHPRLRELIGGAIRERRSAAVGDTVAAPLCSMPS